MVLQLLLVKHQLLVYCSVVASLIYLWNHGVLCVSDDHIASAFAFFLPALPDTYFSRYATKAGIFFIFTASLFIWIKVAVSLKTWAKLLLRWIVFFILLWFSCDFHSLPLASSAIRFLRWSFLLPPRTVFLFLLTLVSISLESLNCFLQLLLIFIRKKDWFF